MSERGATPRRNLEIRVIDKAMKDEAFRQELIAKPRAVLNRELGEMIGGVRLPDDVEVSVLEETPTTLYLVLPAQAPAGVSDELSDAELAGAAGGAGSMCGIGPGGAVTWNPSPC